MSIQVRDYPHAAKPFARVAYFRDILPCSVDRKEGMADTIRIQVPLGEPALAELRDEYAYRCIRTQVGPGWDPEMWQITSVSRAIGEDGSEVAEIQGRSLTNELANGLVRDVLDTTVELFFERYDHTPAELVSLALAGYDGPVLFQAGTIAPARKIETTSFQKHSSLAALEMIATAANGWLRYRWDDALGEHGGYHVEMEDAEAGALWLGPEVRRGKNLRSIRESRDIDSGKTRFVPVGDAELTLAECDWVVDSISGSDLRLVDDTGSRGPVPDNGGWFVGCRIRKSGATGSGFPITATAGALDGPATVSVPGHAGITAGDRVEFLTPGGERLPYIEHPRAKVVGSRRSDVETTIPRWANLIRNPKADWAEGLPMAPHWSTVGTPTLTRVTREASPELVPHGSTGIRVTTTAAGQGIISAPFVWRPTEKLPVLALVISIVTIRGSMRGYLESTTRVGADGKPVRFPAKSRWYADHDEATPGDPFAHVATLASNAPDDMPAPDTYRMVLVSEGPSDWVLDGATASPCSGDSVAALAIDGGPQQLWIHTVKVAQDENTPLVTLEVELAHLYRMDPERWASEKLEINRAVRVFDERLGIAWETRIIGINERLDSLEASGSIELSNKRRDMRSLAGKGPGRGPGKLPAGPSAAVIKPVEVVGHDPEDSGLSRVHFVVYKHSADAGNELQDAWVVTDDSVFPPVTTTKRPTEVPPGLEPTATLHSTGQPVAITGTAESTSAHDPFQPLHWQTESFQANPEGDFLIVVQPGIPGVCSGATQLIPIAPRGDIHEPGGPCGPGYITVWKADGSYQCVPEGEIHYPDPAPVPDFEYAADPSDPGLVTLTSTSTPDPDRLRHTWTIL